MSTPIASDALNGRSATGPEATGPEAAEVSAEGAVCGAVLASLSLDCPGVVPATGATGVGTAAFVTFAA